MRRRYCQFRCWRPIVVRYSDAAPPSCCWSCCYCCCARLNAVTASSRTRLCPPLPLLPSADFRDPDRTWTREDEQNFVLRFLIRLIVTLSDARTSSKVLLIFGRLLFWIWRWKRWSWAETPSYLQPPCRCPYPTDNFSHLTPLPRLSASRPSDT